MALNNDKVHIHVKRTGTTDISIKGGGRRFLKRKLSEFKTICFKENQKIPWHNSKLESYKTWQKEK
jgi:hypothetical protein